MKFYQMLLVLLLCFGQIAIASDYVFFRSHNYDNVVEFWSPGHIYMPASRNGKWGYVAYDGQNHREELIIPLEYDEAYPFDVHGLVRKGREWRIIDKNNLTVMVIGDYDKVALFYGGLAKAKRGEHWGLIQLPNQLLIDFQYEDIKEFGDGLWRAKRDGKWGLIDINNQAKTAFVYDDIKRFRCSKCGDDGKSGIADLYFAKKDKFYGFLDKKTGKEVGDFTYTHWAYTSDDGKWILVAKFNEGLDLNQIRYGVLDNQGKTIIPFDYHHLQMSEDNGVLLFSASKGVSLSGMIDINNHIIVPFDYQSAYYSDYNKVIYVENYDFEGNGGVYVQKNKKVGLFDVNGIQGNIHIPPQYDEIDIFQKSNLKRVYHRFRVKHKSNQGDLFGIVDNHNNVILPIEYQHIRYYVQWNGDEYFTVQKDDKYGVFDMNGNEIVPVQYDTYQEIYDILDLLRKSKIKESQL